MTVKVSNTRVILSDIADKDLTKIVWPEYGLPDEVSLLTITKSDIETLNPIETWGEYKSLCLQTVNKLKSIKGLPSELEGYLRIENANALTTLKGMPKTVNGDLVILGCTVLKEFDYLPEHIGADIYLASNYPISMSSFKHVKYFGGKNLNLNFKISKGLLHLFKIDMPNFKNLAMSGVSNDVSTYISAKLLEIQANPKDRGRVMLDAQDYFMERGLENLANL
jgi:hypothetical protein